MKARQGQITLFDDTQQWRHYATISEAKKQKQDRILKVNIKHIQKK